MKSVSDGTFDQKLPVNMRFTTPVSAASSSVGADLPVTGQHFLTYRWEKTSVADGTFWISSHPPPDFNCAR